MTGAQPGGVVGAAAAPVAFMALPDLAAKTSSKKKHTEPAAMCGALPLSHVTSDKFLADADSARNAQFTFSFKFRGGQVVENLRFLN